MTAAVAANPDLESPRDDGAARPAARPDHVGLVAALFAPTNPAETLHAVAKLARQRFHCDGAGVVLTTKVARSATTAGSPGDAARAEALQVEHHQGPGLDAIALRHPVVSPELRFNSRWRFWAPQVADLGFRSVLSFVLANDEPFGAVTLYSRLPAFFGTEFHGSELGFAEQASIAITVSVEREQLVRARESRGIVGQAQGILMERYDIAPDQAFAVLRRYSSHLNVKLRTIAEQVVRDRILPGRNLSGCPDSWGVTGTKGINRDR
jgi:ANTAR domain/GAF domain